MLVGGEFGHGGGGGEFGLLFENHGQVVEDVVDGYDEFGALLEEAVGAEGGGAVDASGHGVKGAALLGGHVRADQGAAVGPGFDDEDAERTTGDDAVADGEGLAVRFGVDGEFRKDGAGGGDAIGELGVFRRVEFAEAGADDGEGAAFGGEGALVGGGVDDAGEAADNGESGVGHLEGKLFGAFGGVVAGFAGTDHGDGVAVAFGDFAADVEHHGRVVDLAKGGRILVVLRGDDMGAEVGGFFQVGGRVGVVLPACNVFGERTGDAVDGGELVGAGEENFFGGAEGVEEAAQADGSHLRDHVQRDAGLEVGHGGDMLNRGGRGRGEFSVFRGRGHGRNGGGVMGI